MRSKNYFKKIIMVAFIPILALLIGLFATSIFASKADYGNEFKVNGDVLVKYNGTERNVIIPEGIKEIGTEAFYGNPLIETVSLPSSLEKIGNSAFSGCNNLSSIDVGDNVSAIGNSAFYGCTNLKNVSIGQGLRELGYGVFSNCSLLRNVDISSDNDSFVCLDGVIYSKDLSKLYQYLPGNTRENFIIPSEVSKVMDYSFWGADNIRELNLSSAIDSINDYAFANMNGLENVVIYEPTRIIGTGSFANDINLHQVIMPVSMVDIRTSAFTGCPSDLTLICDGNSYANRYANENGIDSASIPVYQVVYSEPSAINQGDDSHDDEATNNIDDSDDGVSNNDEQQSSNGGQVIATIDGTLMDQTTIVSDRAYIVLDDMTVHNLNSNTGNKSLTQIDDYRFYNSNVTNIDLAGDFPNITAIGKLSFARSRVNNIVIPEGITTIDYAAFYHCDQLSNVSIPSTVTYVGGLAFEYTPWFENWKNTSESDFLIVGDGVLIAYKGADAVVTIPDSVKYISQYAFKNNLAINQVILGENVTRIDCDAFYGCESLAIVDGLSDNITVDSNAFNGCGF